MNNRVALMALIIPVLEGFSQSSYYEFNKLEGLSLENLERRVVEEIAYIDEMIIEPFISQYSYLDGTYRQTYFSQQEGEYVLGSTHGYQDEKILEIDNIMHFDDEEYGYLPIIAVNIDEVKKSGKNDRGTWNIFGSVVELTYDDGTIQNAIVLDSCGACSRAPKIDLWVNKNNPKHDKQNVQMKFIRDGWHREEDNNDGTN